MKTISRIFAVLSVLFLAVALYLSDTVAPNSVGAFLTWISCWGSLISLLLFLFFASLLGNWMEVFETESAPNTCTVFYYWEDRAMSVSDGVSYQDAQSQIRQGNVSVDAINKGVEVINQGPPQSGLWERVYSTEVKIRKNEVVEIKDTLFDMRYPAGTVWPEKENYKGKRIVRKRK